MSKEKKFQRLKKGVVGLLKETEDDKIIQIGLRPDQSHQLQIFLGAISQEEPLVEMGEDYELILKSELREILQEVMEANTECICHTGIRFNGTPATVIKTIFKKRGIDWDIPF